MSTDKYRTVLEVDADIKGAEAGLGKFGKELKNLSGESEAAADAAAPLVRELEALEKATRAQQGLESASREVEELATQLTQAQKAVESASKSLEEADQRANAARGGYEAASQSVEELTKEQKELRESLKESGTQKEYVREKLKEVAEALKEAKKEQKDYSKELATSEKAVDSAADSLERKEEAVRETADAQNDAAQALEAWQNRAQAAGLDTENLTRNSVNLAGRMNELESQSTDLAAEVKKAGEELKAAGDASEATGGKLGGLQDNIGTLLAAVGGIAALTASLKSAAVEADQYQQRYLKLEAQIEATGSTAGQSAEGIRELSRELALATLGSVEEFENAAAELLKFTSITDETFERTMRLSKDLAEVMGGNAASSARALGLALEDPAQAASRLRRQGVILSENQQDLIEGFLKTGETAKAQGVILDALEGRVGGVAEAMAQGLGGAIDTLNQRMEDLRLAAGQALEPQLTSIVNTLATAVEGLANNTDLVANAAKGVAAVGLVILLPKITAAVWAATAATTALGAAMRALPLVAVAGGLAAVAKPAAEFAASMSSAARALDEFTANRSAQLLKEIGLLQERIKYEGEGLDAAILTGKELSRLSVDKIAAYQKELEATEELLLVQVSLAARERELAELRGESTEKYDKQLAEIRDKLFEVRSAQDGVAEATEIASSGWGKMAVAASESSEEARKALEGVRDSLEEVGDLSDATAEDLGRIGEEGSEALKLAKAEVDRLNDSLEDLAGESSAVQRAFVKEFGAASEAVEELERVLNDVRIESLSRLGLDAEEIATGLSKAFRDTAASVAALGQSGVATAEELEAALGVLADTSKSQEEVQAVIDLVRDLEDQGKLTTEAMQGLIDQISGMADATDEVEAAFRRLGVTSRAELQKIAQQAVQDYNTIRQSGTASSKDIAAALDALAKRAEASGDRQILAFVEAERAALGLRESIDDVAQSSKVAGDEMESAGQRGAAAFDQAAGAADRLAQAATRAGDAQAGGEGLGGQAVQGAGVPPAASALFNRLSSEFGADFLREYERIASVELTGRFTAAEAAQRASAIMERIARDMRRREGGEERGGGGTGDRRPGGLGQPISSQTVNINVTGVASADPKALDALARQLLPTISKLSRIGA